MKILVTGASGQVGSELREVSVRFNEHEFVFADSDSCDITDKSKVDALVANEKIDAIINCAAYTAVDAAEDNEKIARKVNAEGVRNLVEAAEANGIRLIHISTDYVFDGTSRKPYEESDPVNPMGVYGRTKAEGEKYVINSFGDAIVVRTSWVFSSFGSNFVKTILRLMSERSELKVVSDQFGCPTYARDLAHICLHLATQEKPVSSLGKVYHYTNSGPTNWFDFAKAIASLSGKPEFAIHPIPTSEFPTKAKRPFYSVLATDKIRKDFSITIRDWHEALAECKELIKVKENIIKEQ